MDTIKKSKNPLRAGPRKRAILPDFRGVHLLEAITNYQQRERRFGGLGEGTDEHLAGLQPASEVAEEISTQLDPQTLTTRR